MNPQGIMAIIIFVWFIATFSMALSIGKTNRLLKKILKEIHDATTV